MTLTENHTNALETTVYIIKLITHITMFKNKVLIIHCPTMEFLSLKCITPVLIRMISIQNKCVDMQT